VTARTLQQKGRRVCFEASTEEGRTGEKLTLILMVTWQSVPEQGVQGPWRRREKKKKKGDGGNISAEHDYRALARSPSVEWLQKRPGSGETGTRTTRPIPREVLGDYLTGAMSERRSECSPSGLMGKKAWKVRVDSRHI